MIGNALFAFFGHLDHGDIYSPWTFLPLFYLEGNPVTFVEGFKSRRIDSRMVNKHIGALILFDETITFTLIKPFDNTIGHRGLSFVSIRPAMDRCLAHTASVRRNIIKDTTVAKILNNSVNR